MMRAGSKPRFSACQFLTIARFNFEWLVDQGAKPRQAFADAASAPS